ncbi:hypothetical protein PFISCL1PPCAC_9833 [Pristionchus fissidentatus]|uniref:Uncharacterized protein n=1 Tax=Pristionchus fissidentatus TaxID=1538716 RepID=A0AAV5VGN6_9BILA|nr:hypothetical protein PFISCL1PPCAC_9833 [Pristionchus fissidentatus]
MDFVYDGALIARLAKSEHTELNRSIAPFKVDSITCGEQTRLVLIEKMLVEGRGEATDEQEAELRRKYGGEFVCLEAFFSHNPLTPMEAVQSAFNKNYLTKARSKSTIRSAYSIRLLYSRAPTRLESC